MNLSPDARRALGAGIAVIALIVFSHFSSASPAVLNQQAAVAAVSSTDTLTQLNQSLISANKDKGVLKDGELLEKAVHRKALMEILAKENPAHFLRYVLNASQVSSLSKSVTATVEKRISTEGVIDTYVIDDFKHPEKSRYEYYFKRGANVKPLYLVGDLLVRSNTQALITGYEGDTYVVADNTKGNVTIKVNKDSDGGSNEALGVQNTAVILVDFEDSGPRPFTKEQAQSLFFNGQFNKFMKEQSYNKTYFKGDVYGWYRLPREGNINCLPVSPDEVNSLIVNNRIPMERYSRLIIANNNCYAGSSQVGISSYSTGAEMYYLSVTRIGLSHFNEPSLWGAQPFLWTNLDYLLAHELGHALGLAHANSWDCEQGSIPNVSSTCSHIEYGNIYDAMGGIGSRSLHYNAYYKEWLGFLSPSSVLIINQSGAYSLKPIEVYGGPRLAKIQVLGIGDFPYILEFRQGVGFNSKLKSPEFSSNTQGLFIQKAVKYSRSSIPMSRLLDMQPTQNIPWSFDVDRVTLNRGTPIFVDKGLGISIGPITKVSSSGIDFNITVQQPICVRNKPTLITDDPWGKYLSAGVLDSYYVQVINNDSISCPPSDFIMTATFPSNLWPIELSRSMRINPEQEGRQLISFQIPYNTLPANYQIAFSVRNLQSGISSIATRRIYVITSPVITSIEPNFGQSGTETIIRGTNFGREGYIIFRSNSNSTSILVSRLDTDDGFAFSVPEMPMGEYTVSLFTMGLESNAVTFQIGDSPWVEPTVTVTSATGTIEYDTTREESAIVGTFVVQLAAGSEDRYVSETPFAVAENSTKNWFTSRTDSSVLQLPPGEQLENGTYKIAKNTSKTFTVQVKYLSKNLLPGLYTIKLNGLYMGDTLIEPTAPAVTNTIGPIVGDIDKPGEAGYVVPTINYFAGRASHRIYPTFNDSGKIQSIQLLNSSVCYPILFKVSTETRPQCAVKEYQRGETCYLYFQKRNLPQRCVAKLQFARGPKSNPSIETHYYESFLPAGAVFGKGEQIRELSQQEVDAAFPNQGGNVFDAFLGIFKLFTR